MQALREGQHPRQWGVRSSQAPLPFHLRADPPAGTPGAC